MRMLSMTFSCAGNAGPILYSEELHGEVQGGPARDHLKGDLVGIVFLYV